MPDRRNTGPLPAAYHGKETSYIKHELLRAYLKRLFLIIGMSAQKLGVSELCYVDGFAGPWLDESDDLGSTSIAISLGILDECRQELLLWLVLATTSNTATPVRKRENSDSVLLRGITSSCSAAMMSVGALTSGACFQDSNLSSSSQRTGKYGK